MAELSNEVIEEILGLLERRHDAAVRTLIPNLHPADIADLLDVLDSESRAYLFGLLPPKTGAAVLIELDERHRGELVEGMAPREISDLVSRLESDDAADVVGELDEEIRQEVLRRLSRTDAAELRSLLVHEEDTAGGLMASEFLELPKSATVEDAIATIREKADHLPNLHAVYVGDERGVLTGLVTLRSLLLAKRGALLESISRKPRVTVPPEMDQEEVARLVSQYDVVEVPVVGGDGRMLGVITVDDIVDVIEEEAEEDLGLAAGTGGESVVGDSVLHASGRRLPWLLAGLGGGLLAAVVFSRYELSLKELVSLAFFVPVINGMGGNVAIQSSSIAVRAIAIGPGGYQAVGRRALKEFLVGTLNGLVLGLLLAAVVGVWLRSAWLAALIGCALFAVILISTSVGALVPVILSRMKIDPALATGPFVTTSNDVLGILIYLSLASIFLAHVR